MSWLSPLKPLVVVAALGGVAYLVYIFTTSVPPEPPAGSTALEDIPSIDDMTAGVPMMELPPMDGASDVTPGGAAPVWTPPPTGNASNTLDGLPSFNPEVMTPAAPGIESPGTEIPGTPMDGTNPVSSTNHFAPAGDIASPQDIASNVPPFSPITSIAQQPGAPTFVTAIAEAQQLLAQDQLAQALRQLSALHQNPQLTPAERDHLNKLLDQVAGTVIYSREHRLLGAHQVAANESLDSIAAKYQVSAGLLAKINGIASPLALKPGDSLKVVQGPFHAVIDLKAGEKAGELTLLLDGNYAGRFEIAVVPSTQVSPGTYTVHRKRGFHNLELNPGTIGPGIGAVTIGAHDQTVGLRLSPRDAEDVANILSTGSNVVIRR